MTVQYVCTTPESLQETRSKIKEILFDRWSLDQHTGWDEFGEETIDDIMEVFYG